MTTYYVSETGDNGAGTSWATAKTTLAAALAIATTSGDIIKIDKDHTGDNALGADTTFTFGANISLICVDKDNSDALATMGTAAWIGSNSASRALTFAGAYRVFIYGITLRMAGTSSRAFNLCYTDGMAVTWSNCYLWFGTSSGSARISIGQDSSGTAAVTLLHRCTLRFGATAQGITVCCPGIISECSISADGSAPTTLFGQAGRAGRIDVVDSDLSFLGSGTIFGDFNGGTTPFYVARTKLGANAVVLATQTFVNLSSASVYLVDCSSGDTHGIFGYYSAQGSVVSDTSIYFTSGAAAQSWKITTNASACSRYTPFICPWIPVHHTATSAITPYFEILRDGSATAYQDDEVWAEFSTKVTASTVNGTLSADAMAILGTPADQAAGAGLGSWTGESGTAWSGKCGLGASVTPAETGEILGRLVVGEPGITVYLDPQIRW